MGISPAYIDDCQISDIVYWYERLKGITSEINKQQEKAQNGIRSKSKY